MAKFKEKQIRKMVISPNDLPKGLISFAYHAIFNPVVNEGARLDLMQEMSKFELSDEAKLLIFKAQMGGLSNKEKEDMLVELLMQELAAKIEELQ